MKTFFNKRNSGATEIIHSSAAKSTCFSSRGVRINSSTHMAAYKTHPIASGFLRHQISMWYIDIHASKSETQMDTSILKINMWLGGGGTRL